VLRPGETSASARVLKSLGPFITNFLHVQVEWDDKLLPPGPGMAETIERYRRHVAMIPETDRHRVLHEGHLVYCREDEQEFLTAELAEAVAMVAEPDDMIARIRALEAAGLSHFAFQVTDDPIGQMRYFADSVMRRYH
jgi:hypothetical protein